MERVKIMIGGKSEGGDWWRGLGVVIGGEGDDYDWWKE